MKSLRTTMMIPLFGLLLSAAACGSQAVTEPAASSNNAVAAAGQAETPPHGPHGMHGPGMLLVAALHEPIDLSADQRAKIEATLDTLKPEGPPPEAAAHRKALADAIRAGKIDVDALKLPPPSAAQIEAYHAKLASALDTLHATLTKDQRAKLVAAVENHMAHGPMGEGPKGPPEGAPPAGGPGAMQGPKGPGMHHGGPHFGPMGMLKDLDLTDSQKAAIEKELETNHPAKPTDEERAAWKAHHEAMRKEMDARLQTFVSDDFDAKAFFAKPANAPAKMGPHGDRMLKDLAAIVPILTPAQREKLAQKIEQGPPAKPAPPATK